MKSPDEVRDEAADEFVNENTISDRIDARFAEMSFKFGYDYAVKHDPRVKGLVVALALALYSADISEAEAALKAWEKSDAK